MLFKTQFGLLQLLTAVYASHRVKTKPTFESHASDRLRTQTAYESQFNGRLKSRAAIEPLASPPSSDLPEPRASRLATGRTAARGTKIDQLPSDAASSISNKDLEEAPDQLHVRVKRTGRAMATNGLATSILLLVLAVIIIVGTIITLVCKCAFYIMKCCKGTPVSRPSSAISQIVPVSD